MNDNDNTNKDNMIREKYKYNQPGIRLTIEQVKPVFEEFGYELLSKEYINGKTPLKYICKRHEDKGVQEIKFQNLMHKSKCPYCMIDDGNPPHRIPIDVFKETTESNGYIFVGVRYNNQSAHIDFICPKHEYRGIQTTLFSQMKNQKCVCKQCNGFGRTTDEFKQIMQDINSDIEILGEYKNAKTKIKCRCKIHDHIWDATPQNLMSGFGCRLCGCIKTGLAERIPYEVKVEKLNNSHDDIIFLSIPELTDQYVECECKKCGNIWKASYNNLVKENATGCPKCKSSSGEKIINQILSKYNLNFEQQKRFDECKDIFALPFDFYLSDYNCCIEYDGIQHYEPTNIGGMSNEDAEHEFEITQKHDMMKNAFCKNNNIHLIRIPYWEKNNLEYYLLDQFDDLNIKVQYDFLNKNK